LNQNGIHANWSVANGTERDWLREVKACASRFELADVKFFGKFNENIRTMQCGLDVDRNLTREALSHYD
jgi:hypothetical protein